MTHTTRHGDVVDDIQAWEDLDSYVQEDLLKWLNVSEPSEDDKARLIALYNAGQFHAWNCPTCGERVQSGDPDDWEHFQGVWQPDYSYFGDSDLYTEETISQQCDTCRCGRTCDQVVTWPPEY